MAANPPDDARFIDVDDRTLHYQVLGPAESDAPIVFLHEGLGSVDLWRRFPGNVTTATGRQGLIYSRYGNGWSTPLREPRRPDYMHEEASHVLPKVLDRFVNGAPVLVGHSDGASIALIYAGSGNPVGGLVLIAPHVFVEEETIASIGSIRDRFGESDLALKMSKHHLEPERTFYGWADVWLSPAFRNWNIEEYLSGVSCPILVIQGDADEYGTSKQLESIEAGVCGRVTTVLVEDAGHSPHLSHTEQVTDTVTGFIAGL
ncbi:MAG TPA: alpha/beta hydrolase [Acidimicrobiia bacterium]|nr:alpha/beta hydrolase [Acidimicrobiia bacterium]